MDWSLMWYLITRKGIVGGGGEISRDESVRKENRLTGYDLQELWCYGRVFAYCDIR